MSLLLYMSVVSCVILVPLSCMMEPDSLYLAVRLHREDRLFVWGLLANSAMVGRAVCVGPAGQLSHGRPGCLCGACWPTQPW